MHTGIQQARLDSILGAFYRPAREQRAQRRLLRLSDDELSDLLRHHGERVVTGAQIDQRDQVDDLLTYYSIRELAHLTGYLPLVLDESMQRAREVLARPAVRRFHERHYRLLLPSVLRSRLAGEFSWASAPTGFVDGVVEEMLVLTTENERDRALQRFLWFLDDGWEGDISLADTIEVAMHDPVELARRLSSRQKGAGDAEGVVGFSRFLRGALMHMQLLDGVHDPVTRSALWHVNGYWYSILRARLLPVVRQAQRAVDGWDRSEQGVGAADGSRERDRAFRHAADPNSLRVDFAGVVTRLTSGGFGEPLERVYREAVGKA